MKENEKKYKKISYGSQSILMKITAVVSALLVVGVGILCTSQSKAVVEPVFEPDTDEYTDPYETDEEPGTDTDAVTLIPIRMPWDTEPYSTDTETAETETETAEVTTAETTKAPVTEAQTEPYNPSGAEGKQTYREYNGRAYAENESFVGEYKTDRVSIGVSNVRDGDKSYYICDIIVKSVKDFHTAFANKSIVGRAYTSKIASSVGAGFAVNGDFCGFRTAGIIIREGVLYRSKRSDNWDLCYMNKYGDLIVCKNDKEDGKKLAEDGVWQSWCFGPTLVENYRALTKNEFNTPDLSHSAREPRTAIGQIDELHYIILVVDAKRVKNGVGGWTTVGGMTFTELANTFASLGCKTAYNLDGGGSTTMYLNGKLANEPAMEGERQVSDIIYFK